MQISYASRTPLMIIVKHFLSFKRLSPKSPIIMVSRRYRLRCCVSLASLIFLVYLGYKANTDKTVVGSFKKWFVRPLDISTSPKKEVYDILLIGYLRGGTTFTGDLLGSRDDSFYLYEPLHTLGSFDYFKRGYTCSMDKESCRKGKYGDDEILKIVKAIFTCDYSNYNKTIRNWQVRFSGAIKKVNDPKWRIKSKTCIGTCLRKYLDLCSNYSSIVSKIPRLTVDLAVKLLDTLPKLKIIHLLRDPRGIMNSRHQLKWTPVPGGAISLCNKMTDDYIASQKALVAYPDRLKVIFYEDLAENTKEQLRSIYNFVGYYFDAADERRIAGKTNKSAGIATHWKAKINNTVLRETNKACTHLCRLLGYPDMAAPMKIVPYTSHRIKPK